MRVTDYELFEVAPRWQFLRVETSSGLVGWGEVYAKWHYVGDERVTASAAAVDQMMQKYVLGADPSEIERLWEQMYRSSFYRGGAVHMSAVAGIDEALWDLKGKRYDAPVYDLLGGKARDRVRLYHHASAENAERALEDGFSAIKMGPEGTLERIETPERVRQFVDRVADVRETVGDDVDIGVDFHGRVSRPMVKRLARALEPYEPMFIEEPVTPEFEEAFPELAADTSIPVATGERLHTRFDFKRYFEAGGVDVAQPDVSHAGGITESKKIADAAAARDVALAPHCPIGPIALAASVQVMAVAPSALVQEQTIYHEDWERYVEDPTPLRHEGGYLELPTGPGLGVEIDEETVRELDGENLDYSRPVYEYADGGVGDG
jgi:galactonate dehydratase